MAISASKRYKNEIDFLVRFVKKEVVSSWGDDFRLAFNIKSKYGSTDYKLKTGNTSYNMTLRINRIFNGKYKAENRLKAIEDNGLIYIGVDLDRKFVNDVLDFYIIDENKSKDLDEFVIKSFIRDVFYDKERVKLREYAYEHDYSLDSYDGPLLLGDINIYADKGFMAERRSDGTISFLSIGYNYQPVYDFLSKEPNMIKNLEYFKVCKRAVEDLYSNLNISLADGEFPKLSNRNFLPIVTVDFNKDVASYLCNDRYLYRSVSFPACTKGINKLNVGDFLEKRKANIKHIYPLTNTLKIEYGGKECRCNDNSRLYIDLSVN